MPRRFYQEFYAPRLAPVAWLLSLITCLWLSVARAKSLVPVPDRLLRAIHGVEGDGYGDSGLSLGPYQIHYGYWRDAWEYDPSLRSGQWFDCSNEPYARRVVTAYLNRYARVALMRRDFETLARVHNGGPAGEKKSTTLRYWRRVQKYLD